MLDSRWTVWAKGGTASKKTEREKDYNSKIRPNNQ